MGDGAKALLEEEEDWLDEHEDYLDKNFTPAVKKKILYACLMALTIGNMMILNVVSFMPTYMESVDWAGTSVSESGL